MNKKNEEGIRFTLCSELLYQLDKQIEQKAKEDESRRVRSENISQLRQKIKEANTK